MKGRVLLINPWVYDFTAFDLWAKPLGLLYLGAWLRRQGFAVSLLDCLNRLDPAMPRVSSGAKRLREAGCGGYYREIVPRPSFFRDIPRFFGRFGLPLAVVRERLRKMEPPDIVLVTCSMTYWYPGAVLAGELVREFFPSASLWLGGVYPTLCPEHARRWGFDLVMDTTDPVAVVKRMGEFLGEDFGVRGYPDFFSLWPDFSLYDVLPYGVVLTSVGCPFRCSYCASGSLYPVFFRRPWKEVWKEICYAVQEWKVRHLAFYDDALLFQAEEGFVPLLGEIIRRRLPVSFHLPNGIHVRYVTSRLASLMRQANFRTIRLSLETASPLWQEKTGGKVDEEAFERAVRYFREAGFANNELEVYLLFGWPGSTEEELRASVEYVKSLELVPRLALYAPIPRTRFYEELPAFIQEEPLWHNKIAYLYAVGNERLYEALQRKGGERVCR